MTDKQAEGRKQQQQISEVLLTRVLTLSNGHRYTPDTVLLPIARWNDLYVVAEWLRFQGLHVVFVESLGKQHAVRIGRIGFIGDGLGPDGYDVAFGWTGPEGARR